MLFSFKTKLGYLEGVSVFLDRKICDLNKVMSRVIGVMC